MTQHEKDFAKYEAGRIIRQRDTAIRLLKQCAEFWREGTPVYSGSEVSVEAVAFLASLEDSAVQNRLNAERRIKEGK